MTLKEACTAQVAEHERLSGLGKEHCSASIDMDEAWEAIGLNPGALWMCGGVFFALDGIVYLNLGLRLEDGNENIEGAAEILVGGTPRQAYSATGMRGDLTDPRGALTIKYVELADAVDYVRAINGKPASVIVWENVPGVLSDKGNAFGCFLGALAGEDCALQPPGKNGRTLVVYGPKRTKSSSAILKILVY